MALLEVKDLQVYYGVIRALKGISFHVDQGEIVSLIGANGAGKTTTMQSIMRLIPIKSGSVVYDGNEINKIPGHKLVGMGMSQVPEGRRVFQELTVYENLLLGAYTQKDKKKIKEDIDEICTRFPRLGERKSQIAGTLSGGEQQRIAIARVMLKNAPIIILDEATAFADPDNESRVQAAFSRLSEGKTVIMIAHRLSTVAGADRIYVVKDGQIAESGSSRELMERRGLFAGMWQNYQTSIQWKVQKEVQ